MKILVVDDMEPRHERIISLHPEDEVTSVQQVDTACDILLKNHFDVIYLDHDAGQFGRNYRPVASMIAALYGVNKDQYTEVRVHSANPTASQWLVDYLRSWEIEANLWDIFTDGAVERKLERFNPKNSFRVI